jgi:hypothetical protein
MMKKYCFIACALLVACAGPAGAALTVIPFTDLPPGQFPVYTEGLVSFTAVGGGNLQGVATPNGTQGITSVGSIDPVFFPAMRADIQGGASFVSIDLGKFTWGGEQIFLEIYGPANNLLGDATGMLTPPPSGGMQNLFLFAPSDTCISYAIFGAVSPTGSSVSADNFAFEPCPVCPNVIPAPGAILLGTIGAGLVGHLRRRRAL